jgi:hypothetical protein
MNINYEMKHGKAEDRTYRQFGHLTADETGEFRGAILDLRFRQCPNRVMVITELDGVPIIAT